MKKFIDYFVERHILTNLIFVAVLVGGIFSWYGIKKEEMPDVTFDFIRVSANYPGATAEEVEHFVTKELEEAVRGIDGVYRVTSTSSAGSSSIAVELEKNFSRKDEAITEIRNAVLDTELPEDVKNDPSVRVFETSKKAIIDVAFIHTEVHLLDVESRHLLQEYAIALENQLLNLPHVNSVDKQGYLQEEIQINVNPEKLLKYTIPLSRVKREIVDNHSRQPAGNIKTKNEPKVTINAQLDTIDKLNRLYIQAGFEGQAVSLNEVAEIKKEFNESKSIYKVNGHEAIIFNIVKNSSYGILDSLNAVKEVVNRFKENYLKNTPVDIVLMDDESIDVRNRLSIITMNGAIGFILILFLLFFFLNKKAGFWVAMGIPFTICFTLVCSFLLGFTINNITLAAVIIVMGMIVDDAIVVAENISRFKTGGMNSKEAAVEGTSQVFMPVVASIVTTCAAFIPLYFFSGRFGNLNRFMPPIIFLMLGASLFEALVILPGHMHFNISIGNNRFKKKKIKVFRKHWFDKMEEYYERFLNKILSFKSFVFLFFVFILVLAGLVMIYKMKFVMFPHEETREISLSGSAQKEIDRFKTAELTKKVEAVFKPYIGKEIVGIRTGISRSRRRAEVEENKFRIIVEIVPKEKRRKSADELIALWKPQIEKIEGLSELVMQKGRWGQSSGSPIEIAVQENNDNLRKQASDKLAKLMGGFSELINVEIERPMQITEYKIDFKREKLKRLSINPADISSTFRASLEGVILYELPMGDEEIDVRLSILDKFKTDIESILNVPVENNKGYLVPLRNVVNVEKTKTPNSISRKESKRVTTVYADISPKTKKTPLQIAEIIEKDIFPQVINSQPSTTFSFMGEIYDTREAQGNFRNAVIMVILFIFIILAILFNSLSRPLIIMLAIPFGLVGIILAFLLHGKMLFGFFAGVGALGLAGVVVNDSIIMISKLDSEFRKKDIKFVNRTIASIAKTRLRAVVLTTITTVAGVLPTAYGLAGYDTMLAEMMLALAWGLVFGTSITLLLVPCMYSLMQDFRLKFKALVQSKL